MSEKTCTACGETKPLNQFSDNYKFKDGKLNKCKPCVNAAQKKYNRGAIKVTLDIALCQQFLRGEFAA